MNETDTLLTDKELIKVLRISIATLTRMRQRGDAPPSMKVGGQRRTPLKWANEWLATKAQI